MNLAGTHQESAFNWPKLLKSWAFIALGVLLAAYVIEGIRYTKSSTLIGVVLLLSFLNTFIRPILVLFALPFIIFTLGFGLLLVNAVLIYFAGVLIPDFSVDSFWSALGAALIISLVGLVANLLLGTGNVKVRVGKGGGTANPQKPRVKDDDDVIDI